MPNKITTDSAHELGYVHCSLRGSVVAGSYQTCELRYTAGFAGIDDTGSLKIVMRYATDCGTPQFDRPQEANYTTAVASNGAVLQLRYDPKDHVRPWGKTIYIKVVQGFLRAGDEVKVTLGNRSGGSPGWRVQTFCEDSFELRVLVDRYATYVYEQLPDSPTFRIAAGPPAHMVVVAPSVVTIGQKLAVRSKVEDAWGNPVRRPQVHRHAGFAEPGCQTITVSDQRSGMTATSNPILVVDNSQYGRYWADLHGQSEETVGTNSIDDYFRFARDYGFLDVCAHQGNDFQITDEFWEIIQDTTRRYNERGRFVTFPGWEWSGNTGLGGDRNVLFRKEGGAICRSSRALVGCEQASQPCARQVEDLFARFEQQAGSVILVPHVGGRYADLQRHSPELEPVVEVHSAWGTFEWLLADAFERGYRVGIVANSDGHKGRPGASYPGASTFGSYGGLTCILAEQLDRESIWQAYLQRRVYATTGARILLDVATDSGQPMGSIVKCKRDDPPKFRVRVHGTGAIERVEVRNAMQVLKTYRPYTPADLAGRVKIVWQGAEVRGRGRQVNWDGGLRVTGNRIRSFETINFYNQEKTCRQVSSVQMDWQSTTTGGVAGVIVELEKRATGRLIVETAQKPFRAAINTLGVKGRHYQLGGVGKSVAAYRLPAAGGTRDLSCTFRPRAGDLKAGDNPIYVCVVQEDGHMAWSSPIYLEA